MGFLADTAVSLGETDLCVDSLRALTSVHRARRGLLSEISSGAVARPLCSLAAAIGQWDAAELHFEAAVELNQRLGARPWLAITKHDYGLILLARGAPGDRERAQGSSRARLRSTAARHEDRRGCDRCLKSRLPVPRRDRRGCPATCVAQRVVEASLTSVGYAASAAAAETQTGAKAYG